MYESIIWYESLDPQYGVKDGLAMVALDQKNPDNSIPRATVNARGTSNADLDDIAKAMGCRARHIYRVLTDSQGN